MTYSTKTNHSIHLCNIFIIEQVICSKISYLFLRVKNRYPPARSNSPRLKASQTNDLLSGLVHVPSSPRRCSFTFLLKLITTTEITAINKIYSTVVCPELFLIALMISQKRKFDQFEEKR